VFDSKRWDKKTFNPTNTWRYTGPNDYTVREHYLTCRGAVAAYGDEGKYAVRIRLSGQAAQCGNLLIFVRDMSVCSYCLQYPCLCSVRLRSLLLRAGGPAMEP